MSVELEYLANLTKRENVINKVLWLAAAPQHFNTTEGNGYYNISQSQTSHGCVPHTVTDNDWRNNILKKLAPKYAPHIEVFLEGARMMNEMWDMHMCPPNDDCTHWVYHPNFMSPLWHKLDQLLDEFPSL